ncbi:IS6 family transposase, partial [Bacillus toyonensis]
MSKAFFKSLASFYVSKPRVLTVDKNPVYLKVVKQSKKEKWIPLDVELRQKKYLNNMVEQ